MTKQPEQDAPEPQSDDEEREDEDEKPFTRDDFIRDLRKVADPDK